MKIIIFLFSLLLINCATPYYTYRTVDPPAHILHPKIIPVWIDQDFGAAQIEQIKAAVAEWNFVLNGQIIISIQMVKKMGTDKMMHWYPDTFDAERSKILAAQIDQTGLGWLILDVPSNMLNSKIGSNVLAYVPGEDAHYVVVVGDRLGGRNLKDILMHEFAHLFGALHVNTMSLEYPSYSLSQPNCVDKITAAQVAHAQGLELNTLNYCPIPNFE